MRVEFATIGERHRVCVDERKRNSAPLSRHDPVTTSVT